MNVVRRGPVNGNVIRLHLRGRHMIRRMISTIKNRKKKNGQSFTVTLIEL